MKDALKILSMVLIATVLLWAQAARADPILLNFSGTANNGATIQATLQLSPDVALGTSDSGATWYVVTGITGTVTSPGGIFTIGAISGLDPASGFDTTTITGKFIIDNKATLGTPFFDNDSGLGFYVGGVWANGKNIGGTEMNIWNAAGTNNLLWYEVSPATQQYVYSQINSGNYSGSTNETATPEPATLVMFATGLACVSGTLRRRIFPQL